jgi:hypothetical protein
MNLNYFFFLIFFLFFFFLNFLKYFLIFANVSEHITRILLILWYIYSRYIIYT